MVRGNRLVAWCAPLFFLVAVILAFRLIRGQPLGALGLVLTLLFGLAFAWVLISTLWPARADRLCPECGADALARLDPRTALGLVCGGCGWRDETQSAWLLAEEEGPLEELVLRQRGRPAALRSDPGPSAVDTGSAAD